MFNSDVSNELTFIKMCDPSLSEDFSALLARIATLEDKVGMLSVGAPIAVEPKKATPVKAEESNTNEEVKPVESNATSAKKPLSYWLEIVESLSKEHRAAMGLRNGSRAYKDNDRIIIRVSNSFTIKLMSEESIKNTLAAMISAKEVRAYSSDNICFELSNENSNEDDLFDTLI